MVSGDIRLDTRVLNRRLRRYVQKHLTGLFDFGRAPNSIFDELNYRSVFLTATLYNTMIMLNGASMTLNRSAYTKGRKEIYTRGRRPTKNGSYKTSDGYLARKYYASSKTLLWHIKNNYDVVESALQYKGHNRKVNLLNHKLRDLVRRAVKRGIVPENPLTGITVAFDYFDQDFWGLHNQNVVTTFAEGTKLAFRYGTARVVSPKAEYCLPPVMMGAHSTAAEALKMGMAQSDDVGLQVRTYLLDRYFFTIDAINLLHMRGLRYLMPATTASLKTEMRKRIRNASREHVTIIRSYVIGSDPKHIARTDLVVVPPCWQSESKRNKNRLKKSPRTVVFATNLQPKVGAAQEEVDVFGKELSRIYRLRFGIEADWSILKSFRPRTTSKNPVVRLFYFYVSILLYDAWVYARNIDTRWGWLIRFQFLVLYVPGLNDLIPLDTG